MCPSQTRIVAIPRKHTVNQEPIMINQWFLEPEVA